MTVQRRQDDLADVDRLRRRCDFVAAEEALRAASGNGVEPSSVEIAWGRLELDRDEFREALTRFEEAAALDPRRSDAVGWQVAALSRLCMFDEARAVATGGMRQFPDSAPIGVALARLYLDWERPADALAQFDSVLARHPDDENALEWRIDALRTLHRYADAETAAHEALARHPGSPGILDSLGYVYDDQGRYDDAVACYEEILDRFPDNPVGLRGRVTVLRHAHRYESARTAAAEATERLPGSAQIHVCWSYLDEDRCRYTEALDHLDQALCIQPRCHDALEQRIEVLRKLHRYGEAAAAGQGAEALHPRSPDIIESLAWTCYHQGRYSDALAAFGRALEIHDRHPGALDGRASALRGMCRYAQAEAFISARLPSAFRMLPGSSWSWGFCSMTKASTPRRWIVSTVSLNFTPATRARCRGGSPSCETCGASRRRRRPPVMRSRGARSRPSGWHTAGSTRIRIAAMTRWPHLNVLSSWTLSIHRDTSR